MSSCLCFHRGTSLFITHTAMENDPDEARGNGPNGLIVSQARYPVGDRQFRKWFLSTWLRRWQLDSVCAACGGYPSGSGDSWILLHFLPHQGMLQPMTRAAWLKGNVAAPAPTSAMICCAESTPRPGISAKWTTASWCRLSRLGNSWSSSPIC